MTLNRRMDNEQIFAVGCTQEYAQRGLRVLRKVCRNICCNYNWSSHLLLINPVFCVLCFIPLSMLSGVLCILLHSLLPAANHWYPCEDSLTAGGGGQNCVQHDFQRSNDLLFYLCISFVSVSRVLIVHVHHRHQGKQDVDAWHDL